MSSYPSRLTKTKTSAPAPHVSKRNNRSTHPNSSKSLGIDKDEDIYDRVRNLEASLGQALEDLEHRMKQLQEALDKLVAGDGSGGGLADGCGCAGGFFNCFFFDMVNHLMY
ncbi:hypothetical protein Tco_0789074 [Tanacetum coccineum]